MRALLVVLALAACGPINRTWYFDWNGHPPVDRADRAVQVILENAPCQPDSGWFGGRVKFFDDPFPCNPQGTLMVHGCMPWGAGVAEFAIGYVVPLSSSTLPDEIGHYAWNMCGMGIGEDAAGNYTQGFIDWLVIARAAMQKEGL